MKQAKIIKMNGIRGIITTLVVVSCLFAGFVIFPGYVAKFLWNNFLVSYLPSINLFQGVLLWLIAVLVYFIVNKQSFYISFGTPQTLNDEEMNELMKRIKIQSQAKMMSNIMEEIKKQESNDETHNETKL